MAQVRPYCTTSINKTKAERQNIVVINVHRVLMRNVSQKLPTFSILLLNVIKMAANNTTSLPIIDFAKIIGPSISHSPEVIEESEKEKKKLFQAFVNVGFVYLANHSIPNFARDNLFAHAKKFFALPESEKVKVETGESKAFHGWFSPIRTSGDARHADLKEAFDVGKDNDPTRPNQWPENWPEFRDDMNFFFEKCHEVHLVLLQALAQEVGIDENFFNPHVEAKDHFFRVIYYPETSRAAFKDRLRASAHTDYGTLTLLFNDDSGGLQVRRVDGTYIEAPPIPGCAIINGKSSCGSYTPTCFSLLPASPEKGHSTKHSENSWRSSVTMVQ